jgi:hypothetical protein
MGNQKLSAVIIFTCVMIWTSCSNEPKGNDPKDTATVKTTPRVKAPVFNADSAYAFIQKQVDFGPRVPGTPEHAACATWMTEKLKSFGLEVSVQNAPVTFYDGRKATLSNIFGQFHKERERRVLLLAHWDTRPRADRDSVRQSEPIPGANDGGSGVGVLLEIARVIAQNDPGIGVDILLVDGEDNGDPGGEAETWCLGSQYWAQNRPQGYKADYAILLDMVGAKDAVFPREGTSVYFASGIVEKVWSAAANLGYGNYFVNNIVGQTTDDHLFINMYARIPAIDIVHYDPKRMDYGHFHHRHTDSMEYIDKGTLGAVGHVVLDVLFNEQPSAAQ